MSVKFRIPYPPTVNLYWRNWRGRTVLSTKGRQYRHSIAFDSSRRVEGDLCLLLLVTFPDRRRRDLDNLCKGVLDALAFAGVYDDDSQIKDLTIRWSKKIKKPGFIDVSISKFK